VVEYWQLTALIRLTTGSIPANAKNATLKTKKREKRE